MRFLNCDATGIAELMLQKRDDPALFKQLDRERGPLVYRWRREGNRALNGEHLELPTSSFAKAPEDRPNEDQQTPNAEP